MEQIKIPFFTRVKRAIFNPEFYPNFMLEKTKTAVIYILKVLLILTIILSIAFTYKFYNNKEELFNDRYVEYFGEEYVEQVKELYDSLDSTSLIIMIFVISIFAIYIGMIITIFIDLLIFGVFGYITARICGMKLKYAYCFNISIYAITLPIILLLIYECLELIFGISIKYFSICYDAIAYVYIITAILMLRSDLIKQRIEVGRIIKEQQKVKEETDEENNEEKTDKEKTKKDEKEKSEEEESKEEAEPEGGEA